MSVFLLTTGIPNDYSVYTISLCHLQEEWEVWVSIVSTSEDFNMFGSISEKEMHRY